MGGFSLDGVWSESASEQPFSFPGQAATVRRVCEGKVTQRTLCKLPVMRLSWVDLEGGLRGESRVRAR